MQAPLQGLKKVCFGDDAFLDVLCDVLVVCAGGVQSFLQLVQCLINKIPVHVVTSARHTRRPRDWVDSEKQYLRYFDASEFIERILEEAQRQGREMSRESVTQIKESYMKQRHLFDPRKGDAGTKPALFEDAWSKFMTNEVWKCLPDLVRVHRCSSEHSQLMA